MPARYLHHQIRKYNHAANAEARIVLFGANSEFSGISFLEQALCYIVSLLLQISQVLPKKKTALYRI
jgi:hypothetical protein